MWERGLVEPQRLKNGLCINRVAQNESVGLMEGGHGQLVAKASVRLESGEYRRYNWITVMRIEM